MNITYWSSHQYITSISYSNYRKNSHWTGSHRLKPTYINITMHKIHSINLGIQFRTKHIMDEQSGHRMSITINTVYAITHYRIRKFIYRISHIRFQRSSQSISCISHIQHQDLNTTVTYRQANHQAIKNTAWITRISLVLRNQYFKINFTAFKEDKLMSLNLYIYIKEIGSLLSYKHS